MDLSRIALPVLPANEQELAEHEDLLTQIDKSSGGKTIWRTFAGGEKAMP
jgi:DNA polymerase-3 subunit epsilon